MSHTGPGGVYIAILRARDLRAHGIDVVPRPLPDDPAHAELPQLNASVYKNDDATLERQRLLVELCRKVKGPYGN